MAETLLYTLEIKGTEAELTRLKQLRDNMQQLKEDIKQLEKQDSQAAEAKKIQLKSEQDAYKQLQKDVINEQKAVEKGADTLAKKRAELAKLNKELDNTKIGSQRFKEITAESKKLRDEIKGADEATGRFQGNVGNYKGAIVSAFQQMGINVNGLTSSITAANSAIQMTNVAVGGTSKALRILKVALVSTGIGAIVVVLGSIVAYLTSTQEGMDKINKILKPIGTTLQRVFGILQNVGGAFAKIFSGEAKQGWSDLKDTISGVGDELRDAWRDGQRLFDISLQIRSATLAIAANEGNINRQIAEQRGILDDVNKSENDRLKAGSQIIALSQALKQLKLNELNLQIEQLKLQQEQNDTDAEGQLELIRLIDQRSQLEADTTNRNREAQNKINAIIKKRNDEQIAAAEKIQALQDKLQQSAVDNITALALKIQEIRPNPEDSIFSLFDEEEIDDLPNVVAELGSFQQKELELARATTEAVKTGYAEQYAALEKFLQDGLITEEQYSERRKQLNRNVSDDSIAQLKNVAAEGSAIQKGIFLFEKILAVRTAFLNIQEGFSKTAAAAPFPANIPLLIGFAAQVAGLISAISSVSAPTPPKFARGVIGLRGSGSETSDSIDAKLSRGESVMTAKATRVFAPVLAEMERTVGNTPNYQIGSGRFASGIINAPRTEFTGQIDKISQQVIEALGSIPVVVAEGDITSTQQRVRKIKVAGDL